MAELQKKPTSVITSTNESSLKGINSDKVHEGTQSVIVKKESKIKMGEEQSDKVDSKVEKKHKEGDNGEEKGVSEEELSKHSNYELVDGKYYYTDTQSGARYMYDEDKGDWVSTGDYQVRTDEEGRTYYYADNRYLCRDAHNNVFYLGKDNEWIPWGSETASHTQDQNNANSKWYFHQGNDMFYRNKVSGAVYKLNKDNNQWEVYEGKLKRKRPRLDPDEEFDTDDDEEEYCDDGEILTGSAPPGAKSDPNIEYDGTTYTKRDPTDNMVYEWDINRRAWFPKLDEDFMATYQLSYGFNPDGTKNENPLKFDDEEEEELARQEEEKAKKKADKQTAKKPEWFQADETTNTKVYVSNLPTSITEEELTSILSKCGMILKDVQNDSYKIKMYKDSEGNFKGDALCTYIKRESVELALQILDGYLVGNQKIKVEQAKFELKGEYDPKRKPNKKKKKELEKLKKKQEKLFDWRPEPMRGQRQKWEYTVIIRNVFTPKELEEDMTKLLTHKENMRNHCQSFGQIKKLELYDLHPEGVVQVTFQEVEAADLCVVTLNNRLYANKTLSVKTWDGKEQYKIEETEAEREERLKKWDKYLTEEKNEKK